MPINSETHGCHSTLNPTPTSGIAHRLPSPELPGVCGGGGGGSDLEDLVHPDGVMVKAEVDEPDAGHLRIQEGGRLRGPDGTVWVLDLDPEVFGLGLWSRSWSGLVGRCLTHWNATTHRNILHGQRYYGPRYIAHGGYAYRFVRCKKVDIVRARTAHKSVDTAIVLNV